MANDFASVCTSDSLDRIKVLRKVHYGLKCIYNSSDNLSLYTLSAEQVDNAIGKLEFGKSNNSDKLTAEHIRRSHPIIIVQLSKLFTLIVTV